MKIADALGGVRRLFLDTAPVIYHIEGNAIYQPLTDFVFQRISNGACAVAASPITLAECLVRPFQKQDMALIQRFQQAITADAHLRYSSLDDAAESAAEFRARYNLSLTDAFQITTALKADCDGFLTNDFGLQRVRELVVLVLDELEI